jgi:hypothetical protein
MTGSMAPGETKTHQRRRLRDCAGISGSSVAVCRMSRIERPAISADLGTVPVQVYAPLHSNVAIVAQRLKRTESKRVPITTMRGDMVGNGRGGDDTTLDAEGAQGFGP